MQHLSRKIKRVRAGCNSQTELVDNALHGSVSECRHALQFQYCGQDRTAPKDKAVVHVVGFFGWRGREPFGPTG